MSRKLLIAKTGTERDLWRKDEKSFSVDSHIKPTQFFHIKMILFLGILLLGIQSPAFSKESLRPLLLEDQNWIFKKESKDGYQIFNRPVPGYSLNAARVSAITAHRPEVLLEIIHDIPNYSAFLKSASAIDFGIVKAAEDHIIGYQHINIPIVSNRHYLYRFDLDTAAVNGEYISGWTLLAADMPEYQNYIAEMTNKYGSSVYLDDGEGVFRIRPAQDGLWEISYSLYMDIGGRIPGFVVEFVNVEGITGLIRDLLNEADERKQKKEQ
jgi:hypothetical protein